MVRGSFNIRIQFKGLRKLNRDISLIDLRFRGLKADEFAEYVILKAKAILHKRYVRSRAAQRTGQLEASITKSVRSNIVTVRANAPHATIVERGRDAIEGRMRFIGKEGNVVFARRVRETKAKRFMSEAGAWARRYYGEYTRRRVNRIIRSKGTAHRGRVPNINASFSQYTYQERMQHIRSKRRL